MIKILFVTTVSSTAYVFLLDFAHYLKSKGFDVEFACSNINHPDTKSRSRELAEQGFIVHNIPFSRSISPLSDLNAFLCLCNLFKNRKYDIVHVHTAKAGWIGRIAATLIRVPLVVYTAHDFYFRSFVRGFKRSLYIFLEKFASPYCDLILFVSEAVKSEAIKEGIKKSEYLVWVGNGIQCKNFTINTVYQNSLKHKYKIDENSPIIGVVARLVGNKGLDIFIKASTIILAKFPKAKFIICGSGPEEKCLSNMTKELNIDDKVIFTGHVDSKEELIHIMASFDIFLFPTRREGLGIVYIEAMALGIPVVGTRIPPVTEVIVEGQTGLLAAPEDYNAFALSAISLLSDTELRIRLAEAGRKRAFEFFDLPVINQRTLNAYYSAISKTKSAKILLQKWPKNI